MSILISGANSLYVFMLENKYYFFFGDQHFSIEERCEDQYHIQCDLYDYGYKKTLTHNTNCWTIGSLFDEWFTYNNYFGVKTDFYLETGFIKGTLREATMTTEEISDRRQEPFYQTKLPQDIEGSSGWLESVAAYFQDCFIQDKSQCKYSPNVRFHYADIRNYHEYGTLYDADLYISYPYIHLINEELINLNRRGMLIQKSNNQFTKIKNQWLLTTIMDDVNSIFVLYDNLWNINILLALCFSTMDVRDILNSLEIPELSPNIQSLFINSKQNIIRSSVTRNDVLLHRTAAEFNRLKNFNSSVADKLETYITNRMEIELLKALPEFNELQERFQLTNDINELIDIVTDLQNLLSIWNPWILDVYTLSRMFLQHDSEQIVIFAGHYHINIQSGFFKYLGANTLVEHPARMDDRCITTNLTGILDVDEFRNLY